MRTLLHTIVFILFIGFASAQNVGIGSSAPASRLDVSGDLALREGTAISVSGANPGVTLSLHATNPEFSFYRIIGSPTGVMTLGNIANGVDGQIITLVNTTPSQLKIADNNTAGGIRTTGSAAQYITTNGSITIQYSSSAARWYITKGSGIANADWTKATTTDEPAGKSDNQYITGNAGIGDFSTATPSAMLHVKNGVGTKISTANATAIFDGGSGAYNSRVLIGSNWTGTGTRPESQLEFWNNAFGGVQANSATIATVSSQGSASGQVYGNLLLSTSNNTTAPTERMRIESDGDVGIGTNAPYAKLDVLGSIYTTLHGSGNQHDVSEQGTTYIGMKSGSTGDRFAGMKMQVGAFGNGGVNNGSRIFFQTWGNSISTSRDVMVINEYGNVGIGTSAPNANLEIYKQDGKIRISDTRPDGGTALAELGLEFTHHNTNVTKTAIIAKGIYSWKRADLHFILDDGADDSPYVTGTNTRMIIKNNGNVGIGTITPNAPLQFANTAVNRKIVLWESTNNDHQFYGFGINGGTLRYQVDGTSSAHKFYCGTSATTSKQLAAFGGDGNFYMGDPNATVTYDINILPARPIGGANATYLRLGSSSNFVQDVFTNNVYAGRVRIGSSSATFYPLEVSGTASWTADCREFWHTYGGSWSGWASRTKNVAILSHGSIAADGDQAFISASDVRIKKDINHSNSTKDLELLNALEIMDYRYRDSIFNENGPQKKVIAQQVETVYPQAVTTTVNCIPDIYAEAREVLIEDENVTFVMDKVLDLKAGDFVKVYDEDGSSSEVEVLSRTDSTFTAAMPSPKQGRYFVYGKRVDDFRSVDYDALSMLNISATQELYKRIVALEKESSELKTVLSETASAEDVISLKKEMEDLKKLLLNAPATGD